MNLRYVLLSLICILLASGALAQESGPRLTLSTTDTTPQIGLLATESVTPDAAEAETAPKEAVEPAISEVRHVRPVRQVRHQTEPKDPAPMEKKPEVRQSNRPDKIAMLADLEKKDQSPAAGGSSVTAKTVLSTILKLAVVLVLAYLTILALKWLSVKKDAPPQNQGDFRVKDTLRLSPTGTLHLVDVKGKTLLIGCSSGQVNLIREFDETEQVETESDGRFAQYLERYSQTSRKHGAAGRVAGLLRDCTTYLKERRNNVGGDKR